MSKISSHTDSGRAGLRNLPELPSIIRYYDDFDDKLHTIADLNLNVWQIYVGGELRKIDFAPIAPDLQPVVKSCCAFLIQSLSAATATIFTASLHRVSDRDLALLVNSSPQSIRENWDSIFVRGYDIFSMNALKNLLRYFCKFSVGNWTSDFTSFLLTLRMPAVDKYASVRTGDVFLSIDEEALLVRYFDDMTEHVKTLPRSLTDSALNSCAILLCSYQFGMRPLQIGMLQVRDVRIWHDQTDPVPSVHLTFKMVKQRSKQKSMPLPRKVKREWAPLFVELFERCKTQGKNGVDRIFEVESSRHVSQIIGQCTKDILPFSRNATELRHTAAQRLADAGASQEELAEFLGHSDNETALVYFQTSPNQAERVNKALGISNIYQKIAKIAHDRFISAEELTRLKGDQQIAGTPHGIAITGIGGCSSGQPACPYNPITSCYGCRKFMPLHDAAIHKKVLEDFRSVVAVFIEASRGDEKSPAYQQLQRTISSVQGVIYEIEVQSP